ncbi:MAG: hypothetical protein Q9191_003923 [Dirinaria sp. TL-2023a]
MTPSVFYRVHDDSSATHFDEEYGFLAGDDQTMLRMFPRNDWEATRLRNALDRHLDWFNRTASSFISVYVNYDAAFNGAIARKNQGKRGIFIAHIDVRKSRECMWRRNVREVAVDVDIWIQQQAWNNSEYEYLFLNHISAEAVTKLEDF